MHKLVQRSRKKFFPFKTMNGIECIPVSSKEMYKFLTKNFTTVFGKSFSSRYQPPVTVKRKLKPLIAAYGKIHTEHFLFKKGKTVVGWSYGEMDDFETFYMRNTGVLPDYRKSGIYSEFLVRLLQYLQDLGYQRVSSQHHPDNLAVIKTS